ncbi:hypothetical protein D3C86_1535530 [compost metagenome]
MTSAVNCSVSREPVPLPMTISWMPYLAISSLNLAAASFFLLFGGVGYVTATSSSLPVSSTTASLQPVR